MGHPFGGLANLTGAAAAALYAGLAQGRAHQPNSFFTITSGTSTGFSGCRFVNSGDGYDDKRPKSLREELQAEVDDWLPALAA